MKNLFFAVSLFLSTSIFSQPDGINYQAIVRGNGGQVLAGSHVSMRFTIHDLSPAGAAVWQETHAQTTNQYGLFNIVLGSAGSSLYAVNWATGTKYLQVEVDVNGGNSYTDMGTTQLMSVPYALYAGRAKPAYRVVVNGTDITDIGQTATSSYGGFATCMTATGYYYNINRGVNTVETFNRGASRLYTDDTISGTLYVASPLYGCASAQYYNYQGLIVGASTGRVAGVYYIPQNAYPLASAPRYYLDSECDYWHTNYSTGYAYYELVPNDNAVTGFNITLPAVVDIRR